MKRLHNDNRNETADFVLHESTMRQMRYLTMEARGRLMTMMVDFAANGGKAAHGGNAAQDDYAAHDDYAANNDEPADNAERPGSETLMIKLIFEEWRLRYEADKEAYNTVCRQRAEAGRKGLQKRWGKMMEDNNDYGGGDCSDYDGDDDSGMDKTAGTTDETENTANGKSGMANAADTMAKMANGKNAMAKIPNAKNTIAKIADTDFVSDYDYDNDSDFDKEKKETPTIVGAKKKISLASPLNDRKHEFYQSILPYYDKYSRDMLNDFYEYWTELDKRGKRMRFEMQKTWETGKRLSLWSSRTFH